MPPIDIQFIHYVKDHDTQRALQALQQEVNIRLHALAQAKQPAASDVQQPRKSPWDGYKYPTRSHDE